MDSFRLIRAALLLKARLRATLCRSHATQALGLHRLQFLSLRKEETPSVVGLNNISLAVMLEALSEIRDGNEHSPTTVENAGFCLTFVSYRACLIRGLKPVLPMTIDKNSG